jgi:hypothetical protein
MATQRKVRTLEERIHTLEECFMHLTSQTSHECRCQCQGHQQTTAHLAKTMQAVARLQDLGRYAKFYFKGFSKVVNEMAEAVFLHKHEIIMNEELDNKVVEITVP